MENIINQIKEFPMVANLLSPEQVKEIGEDKLAAYVAQGEQHQSEHTQLESKKIASIQALQDKTVIDGLTDREKAEYKELRGL